MNPHLDLPQLEYARTHPRLFELADTFVQIQRRIPLLFEDYLAPYHLSYLAWNALALVQPMKAHATLTAIGDAIHASPSTMTGIAARLVQAGLVRRVPSPSDRRASILQLTDEGERIRDEILERFFGDLTEVADEIGADKVDEIAASFEHIIMMLDLMEQRRPVPGSS